MTVRPILIAPDPALKATCEPVAEVDAEVCALMNDLLETMYEAPGIGLAAPQIGVLKRVCVIDVHAKDEEPQPVVMGNPEVVCRSDELITVEEGCLSIPGITGAVPRYLRIRYSGVDPSGREIEREASGFHARVVQHEIDHLDGLIFPMRMTDLSLLSFNEELRHFIEVERADEDRDAAE